MEVCKAAASIICPGRCYRNESQLVQRASRGSFHQVDGFYVDEGVSFQDLN